MIRDPLTLDSLRCLPFGSAIWMNLAIFSKPYPRQLLLNLGIAIVLAIAEFCGQWKRYQR